MSARAQRQEEREQEKKRKKEKRRKKSEKSRTRRGAMRRGGATLRGVMTAQMMDARSIASRYAKALQQRQHLYAQCKGDRQVLLQKCTRAPCGA